MMFVDTNVLVHASAPGAPDREKARAALARHATIGEQFRISRQILREFVAVNATPALGSGENARRGRKRSRGYYPRFRDS